MKLLIVEDDDNKQSQISSFLNSQYSDLTLEVARSLKSGLKQIRTFNPDLVLLDMTLPTYDVGPDEPGGSTHALGGREFLRELKRYRLNIPSSTQGLSSQPFKNWMRSLCAHIRKSTAVQSTTTLR
jgi:CheY-like chemotaxis protein